jgi:hypothetical protein
MSRLGLGCLGVTWPTTSGASRGKMSGGIEGRDEGIGHVREEGGRGLRADR